MIKLIKNPLRTKIGAPRGFSNIAHRGARAYAPENTVQAFRKAVDLRCDMFELDVHLSRDGQIVVHHDDDLLRCTDVIQKFPGRDSYFLSDFTYDELRTLDAGSWYVEELKKPSAKRQSFLQDLTKEESQLFISEEDRRYYASGEVKLPTLVQALEVAQAASIMINVEIKTMPRMYVGLAKSVVSLIETMNLEHCVLISSFDHEQLIAVRKMNVNIPTAVLTSDRLAKPASYLELLDADAYNPGCYAGYDSMGFSSVDGRLITPSIEAVLGSGYGVNVWTCNKKEQIQQLIEAGVTGIFSDYPNRVTQVSAAVPRNKSFDPH
jgi:glycerophosphoryl diester phosphodiesterase